MYEDFIEDEIISIEELSEEMETMDIEVGGDHLFVANDILTHNSAYDKNQQLSLTQIGEAIKKVEHSDFVGLIRSIFDEQQTNQPGLFSSSSTRMEAVIKKNRSGPKEKMVNFLVNFSHFRITDNSRDVSVPFENTGTVSESFV